MHMHAEIHLNSLDDWQENLENIMDEYFIGFDFDNEKGFYDYWGVGERYMNSHIGKPWCLEPTEKIFNWRATNNDIMAVKEVVEDLTAFTLIANGEVFHADDDGATCICKETGSLDTIHVKEKLKELGISGGYLVTVDYHI